MATCTSCEWFYEPGSRCEYHRTTVEPTWRCDMFEAIDALQVPMMAPQPTGPATSDQASPDPVVRVEEIARKALPPSGLVRCSDCQHDPGRGRYCPEGRRHATGAAKRCGEFAAAAR